MARRSTSSTSALPANTRPDLAQPLLGQSQAAQAFVDAVQSGRLHHGWLLHGQKGIGKAKFAHHTSAYLVADKARVNSADLGIDVQHPDARLIAQGAHPDAFWLDRFTGLDNKKPPKTIPVAQVRATLQKLQSTPAYGGWRALVIDSVDELNNEGANALLKPLEEPPRQTVIFLIAHSLSAVLPTIRSRCRHVAMSGLGTQDMEHLALHLSPDGTDATTAALASALASASPGRMGQLLQAPQTVDIFAQFCDVSAATHAKRADQLALAGLINALQDEDQRLVFSLIEHWMSRRLRDEAEPAGLPSPRETMTTEQKNLLAQFWSEQTSALAIRRAINLDVSERVMALFAQLERVYSQHNTH